MIESQIKKLYVPAEFGLYNQEFSEFIRELNSFLDHYEKSEYKVLCLLQTGVNTDLNQNLYDQLYHDKTFDDVYDKILLVRKTLARLRTANLITVSSSFYDCFGSVFELFLSCQHRLNFDESCQYGFNEIHGDFFPCAGAAEQLIANRSPAVARFKDAGAIPAKEAAELGLIHFSINADDHYELTNAWILSKLSQSTQERSYPISQNRMAQLDDDQFLKLQIDGQKMQKLKIDFTTDYCFQNRSPRAYGFCENLILNPPKGLNPGEVQAIVAYMTSRYALTPRFKGWFKSWLKKTAAPCAENGELKLNPVFSVYPYVPPAQPLSNALMAGQSLVFYSESSTHLKNGVDLFVGRLEQQVGKERSLQILKNQINWVIAKENELLGYKVVFETNSQFTVCKGQERYRFFHTLNSKIDLEGILAEFPEGRDNDLPEKFTSLLTSFCESIFETKSPFSTPTPIIVIARSIFLQEITNLCQRDNLSLDHILECLKVSGWRFASESSSWERFMRGRQAFLQIPEAELQNYIIPLKAQLWRIGLWKELRNQLKVHSGTNVSVTFVSRHFMALACHIVKNLTECDTGLNGEQLDKLICTALGVPENYGTTERYTYAWGSARLSHYQQHHWSPNQ